VTRKICVVTGSRAEYGLLRWTMHEIQNAANLELQLIVTGSHLSPVFGETYQEIEADGFVIDHKLDILVDADSAQGVAKSVGLALISFSDVFARLNPDMILILGDRFEIFAVAATALMLQIPIAHCHGGELTRGAIDDSLRHSITKMAHFHFTSTEDYRRRVIQLGESPDRVFNVGAFGLEAIDHIQFLEKEEIEKRIGQSLNKKTLLIGFHPETYSKGKNEQHLGALLTALDHFPNLKLVFTLSNPDQEGRSINRIIKSYAEQNPERAVVHANLGQTTLFSLMRHIDGVVGNSSSGIIEAPAFKIGTINIGDRQQGRVRCASIIDAAPNVKAIKNAIQTLYSARFRREIDTSASPYSGGRISEKVVRVLRDQSIENLLKKKFFDLDSNGFAHTFD
jgi:GDP/UDP-N,N'-diacetylbacillosamine 2-epimerase (hydrolysing)